MSTKVSILYSEGKEPYYHLYFDYAGSKYWLETDTMKVALPVALGQKLERLNPPKVHVIKIKGKKK
jgi:hypothetical protein